MIPTAWKYARAFRSGPDKLPQKLRDAGVKYRFRYCAMAQPISKLYNMLSAEFVHGRPSIKASLPTDELSCEFIDRRSPASMTVQFELVQTSMALAFSCRRCILRFCDAFRQTTLWPMSWRR